MTVVEGIVAALLVVVGALGVLQVLDAATRNNLRSEQSQVIANRLQAELERIRQLPYAEIALAEYPAGSTDSNDPRNRLAGSTFAVDRTATTDSQRELVVAEPEEAATGGGIPPGPEPFSTGDVSGEIHRFVTWAGGPGCAGCDGQAMKRVIVAAKVDDAPASFGRAFQEMHTDIPDPEARPEPNPGPPGEEQPGNAAELWLTDTACDSATRLAPEAPHPTHNTEGRCADGSATGETPGAPDLLFTEPPPGLEASDDPPLEELDFSSDIGGSDDGVGLTMPWPEADRCELRSELGVPYARRLLEGSAEPLESEPEPRQGLLGLPGDEADGHARVHTWLSGEVGEPGAELTGEGTLNLWTRTVNGSFHPGEICVSLFIRHRAEVAWGADSEAGGSGELEVDVPVVNLGQLTSDDGMVCQRGNQLPYFRCARSDWPAEASKASIPLRFGGLDSAGAPVPLALPPGSRVGVALMVRKGGTEPGQGLEFVYDHVDFESRLQLRTESLVCLGDCEV